MTVAPVFEIKIALVGYVSVGKTAVLNALFRDKYSEMAMRRATAGVNHFRVTTAAETEDMEVDDNNDGGEKWTATAVHVDNPRTAASILQETTVDNATLRESNVVQEKTFDVELDEPLCKMRKDTRLVVVDIPGINEAGTSSKYKDYVAEKWYTFDCVVVVMDGRQGVNTEEQVELLRFVEENCRTKKAVPVIVLCNKVDEPDDKEQQVLIKEARTAVENIFRVGDREKALRRFLDRPEKAKVVHPAFIPISALQAFIYQTASRLDFEQFKKFDMDLIDKLGRESFGKRWRRFSAQKKYEEAFKVVSDPNECREGLEASSFDKFLKVLIHSVGGETNQRNLLQAQLGIATSLLSSSKKNIGFDLHMIYERRSVLNQPTNELKNVFWRIYKEFVVSAFAAFSRPGEVLKLADPMNQLASYYEFTRRVKWDGENVLIVEAMKKLVQRQIGVLLEKEHEWSVFVWQSGKLASGEILSWADISPLDWVSIFASVLLPSSDRYGYENFGKEKMAMESCLARLRNQLVAHFEAIDLCPSCMRGQLCAGGVCSSCNETDVTHAQKNYRYCNHCGSNRNFRGNKCTSCRQNCGQIEGACVRCPSCSQDAHFLNGVCSYCHKYSPAVAEQVETDKKKLFEVKYVDGTLQPCHDKFKVLAQIQVPDSVSDPKHFGHLLWRFCRFMESVESK